MFALRRVAAPIRSFTASARALVQLQPPEHLDDKERHVFTKLSAALEPSRLEVRLRLSSSLLVRVLMMFVC